MATKKTKKTKGDKDVRDLLRKSISAQAPLCLGQEGGKLSNDRTRLKALYLGQPYKADKELSADGWSTYIDRTVMETVEWCKPSLFRIFGAGDELIRFDAIGKDDEQAAQDATDWVNSIFGRNAFTLVHHSLTDGLYQRLGWAKAWYEKTEKVDVDEREGLLEEEALAAVLDSGVPMEDVEVSKRLADDSKPAGPDNPEVFDLTIRRRHEIREIRIEPVPSENVLFLQDARDIEKCRLTIHWEDRTVSELLEEGHDEDLVKDLPSISASKSVDMPEKDIGRSVNSESPNGDPDAGDDNSTRLVRIFEAYTYADINGDGRAEMVKVVYGGELGDAKILSWEEWPLGRPPLFPVASVPLPHSIAGLCVADLVEDLQSLKSELTRYGLDNLYLNNQGEIVINKSAGGSYNLDQLLARRAGGVYETEGPVQVTPLAVANTGTESLAWLEKASEAQRTRTGIDSNSAGVNADALQGTATGAEIQEEIQNLRVELIARIYAETFFKPLGRYILRLATKYQDKPLQMKVKGRYLDLDPKTFNLDWDVRPAVGLGTGNRSKLAGTYAEILSIQREIMAALKDKSPIGMRHVIYTCHKLAEARGLESPERFFGSLEDAENVDRALREAAQQPQTSPEEEATNRLLAVEEKRTQAKIALDQAKARADITLKREKAQADIALAQTKIAAEHDLKAMEVDAERDLEAAQMLISGGGGGFPVLPPGM